MENTVKVRIDGKEVEAPAGTNLIDAAGMAGIHIPNLCYLKGMKGIGACRLCLVEVEGLKAPVIACNTKVKEGMAINTCTEKVREVRRFVVDLLLSMHPLDCMTCTKSGACNLQKYAYQFEIKESSFLRKKAGYPVDSANPFIKRDPDYCVLCGRCVRVCKEQGTNVLDFMGRGIESKVVTSGDKPLQESECTFCGSCVDACPVNALLEADRSRKGREWEFEGHRSVCLLCGNACDISVSTKDGQIQKINSGAPDGSCEKYLCAYGRFGFDSFEGEARLKAPLKRVDGKLVETTWEDALKTVAGRLKGAGGNAGFVSTAGILNEDAIVLQNFAKHVVKTKDVDTTLSLYGEAGTFVNSHSGDIEESDLIVLAGLAPSQWDRVLPALDAAVRRRVARGAKLVVITEEDSRAAEAATVSLIGDVPEVLRSVAKALVAKGLTAGEDLEAAVKDAEMTEDTEKAAALISDSKEPLIFASPSCFNSAANLALLKGKVISVGLESNSRGVALIGLRAEGRSYGEMISAGSKVLYAIGEIPLAVRPDTDFLVVQNSHLTELAKLADVVLPSTMYLESYGTIVDYLGRVKKLPQVIEPLGQSKGHARIFIELAREMGSRIEMPAEESVNKAVGLRGQISFKPFEKKAASGMTSREFIEAVNKSVINGSRLVWLTMADSEVSA